MGASGPPTQVSMNHFNVHGYSVALSNTVLDVGGSANNKQTSCRFAWLDIGNNNAAVSYVQIFNLPAASVTLGTTAPLLSIEVPANSGRVIAPGALLNFGGSGFSIAASTTRAGNTAPTTAVDVQVAY